MSSNRFVFAVLISLFLAVVPVNNPAEMLQEENEIQSSGAALEDYELYLGSGTTLTTKEPSGAYDETSLLGSGVTFQTNELISDLNVQGKSSSELRTFVYLQFRSSNNNATGEVTFRLYSGSDVIQTFTEPLNNPCNGFFGGCNWNPYQINLNIGNGFDVVNGDRIKLNIEATADCEAGGAFSSCEVLLAHGGQVGNGFSRMEFRANALEGSQVKVHEMGDGWSESEVTEWSPTHSPDKREMQFTVDVRDAFGRADIESVELVLYTPNEASAVFEKEFEENELKLDNDGLVGKFNFTYESGIAHGEYPLAFAHHRRARACHRIPPSTRNNVP